MWSSAQAFGCANLDTSYRASSSRRTSAFLFPLGECEGQAPSLGFPCCSDPKPACARLPAAETKAHPLSNQSCPRWRDLMATHGIQDENPWKFSLKVQKDWFLMFLSFNLHLQKSWKSWISMIYAPGRGYRFDPLRLRELSHTYCDQTWHQES